MTVPLVYYDEAAGKWVWAAHLWVQEHDHYGPADREDEPFRGYSLSDEDRTMLARLAAALEDEETR